MPLLFSRVRVCQKVHSVHLDMFAEFDHIAKIQITTSPRS